MGLSMPFCLSVCRVIQPWSCCPLPAVLVTTRSADWLLSAVVTSLQASPSCWLLLVFVLSWGGTMKTLSPIVLCCYAITLPHCSHSDLRNHCCSLLLYRMTLLSRWRHLIEFRPYTCSDLRITERICVKLVWMLHRWCPVWDCAC
jgi:hypothetical protein